jgi:ribosome-associated protein
MHDPEYKRHATPSKTRRKRDMEALQELGSALLDFSEEQLQQLDLPEKLLDAVREAGRIHAYGARRRQLQYIGKLMRDIDPAPIRAAIAAREHQQETHTQAFHLLEELRDALLLQGDAALGTVLEHFPLADRQHLRKLARQARREHDEHQPPKASRRLFRYLRELQEADAL